MKKIAQVSGILLFSLFIAVFFESCCTDKYRIIGNGELVAYDSEYAQIETISTAFRLENRYDTEIAASSKSLGLINSAYATTCEYHYVNAITESSITLSADKDFIYKTDTIFANTDILSIEDLDFVYHQDWGPSVEIRFNDDFISNAIFEKSNYTFKLTSKSDNDLEFESEVSLMMDL